MQPYPPAQPPPPGYPPQGYPPPQGYAPGPQVLAVAPPPTGARAAVRWGALGVLVSDFCS